MRDVAVSTLLAQRYKPNDGKRKIKKKTNNANTQSVIQAKNFCVDNADFSVTGFPGGGKGGCSPPSEADRL